MIRVACIANVLLLLTSSLLAGEEPPVVRRDTEIPVEVHGTVKSKSAKVGDSIEFRTAEAVLIGNNIVVPGNATVLGTVIEVRNHATDSPHALIRIRIHTLRWKDGEAPLNAMVAGVRRGHPAAIDRRLRMTPTFLEGIKIVSYRQHQAYTEFYSDQKDVKIRSGVSLTLRQVDPDEYPDDSGFDVYSSQARNTTPN